MQQIGYRLRQRCASFKRVCVAVTQTSQNIRDKSKVLEMPRECPIQNLRYSGRKIKRNTESSIMILKM